MSPPSRGAYEVGSTWISSQPEPSLRVLGGLAHQPLDVLGLSEAGPRRVVQPLEAEPAALVGRPQAGRFAAGQGLGEGFGQPDAVLVGQLQHGGGPHRTGEVQVQMGFRQFREITYALHSRILPYVPAVSVALSSLVVLLARSGPSPPGNGPAARAERENVSPVPRPGASGSG